MKFIKEIWIKYRNIIECVGFIYGIFSYINNFLEENPLKLNLYLICAIILSSISILNILLIRIKRK